jgi:hypothetical protein
LYKEFLYYQVQDPNRWRFIPTATNDTVRYVHQWLNATEWSVWILSSSLTYENANRLVCVFGVVRDPCPARDLSEFAASYDTNQTGLW